MRMSPPGGDADASAPEPAVRYVGVLPVAIASDSWVVVEAGGALPADPDEEPATPYTYTRITTGFSPLSFTNPVFIDFDGNGRFAPPGL